MAFDQSSSSAISNSVSWELTNGISTQVRVAIEADVGATNTWTNLPAFNAMLARLDDPVQLFLKQALAGLDPKELRTLRDLLGKVRAGARPFPVERRSR